MPSPARDKLLLIILAKTSLSYLSGTLRTQRSHYAREGCARALVGTLDPSCGRVRAAEHAPRNPCRFLERRHGFAEIAERGAIVSTERQPVAPPHIDRELSTLAEHAPRHRQCIAHQCLHFAVAM
jgi:hypothetical protein